MSLESVKAFYLRLASDEMFRTHIQDVKTKEECSQIVKAAGYDFTQEEYEEYTAQLLETGATDGELRELDEKELEAVFGGAIIDYWRQPGRKQPLYGVVVQPPGDQMMYGVVRPDYL